jgi:hypothetical protein
MSTVALALRGLGSVHRGLDVERVLVGLGQDGVGAAGDQAIALDRESGLQRVIGNVAEARQLGARADVAHHPAVAAVAEALRRLARQLDAELVDLEGAGAQLELLQRDRRAAKGVGEHHVGAGRVVATMDVADDVGPRQAEHLRAVLLVPVVLLDIEGERLHAAAHAAVAEQDAVAERLEEVRTGHGNVLSILRRC